MSIKLVAVDKDNIGETLRLSVSSDQTGFVASTAVSIAYSKYYPTLHTDAVYDGDTMVGFVMYGYEPISSKYMLARIMIDAKYQGKGYGRSATEAVIERLKNVEECDAVYLSCVLENTVAEKLYESIGFEKTGEIDDGETVMKLKIEN